MWRVAFLCLWHIWVVSTEDNLSCRMESLFIFMVLASVFLLPRGPTESEMWRIMFSLAWRSATEENWAMRYLYALPSGSTACEEAGEGWAHSHRTLGWCLLYEPQPSLQKIEMITECPVMKIKAVFCWISSNWHDVWCMVEMLNK